MDIKSFLFCFLVTINSSSQQDEKDVVERVKKLKEDLRFQFELKNKMARLNPLEREDASQFDNYEYETFADDKMARPIMNEDERKIGMDSFFKIVKPTTTTEEIEKKVPVLRHLRKKDKRKAIRKIERQMREEMRTTEKYYRRNYNLDKYHELKKKEQKWMYCNEVVTPYFSGVVTNYSKTFRKITERDHLPKRLVQLINIDTESFTLEEIYAVLYQISNLNIKLFMWKVNPMKMLLNAIVPEKKHSFRTLKQGIHSLFVKWRLDISNVSSLLIQSKLFRPPCIVNKVEGSTVRPTRVTFTPRSTTTRCPDPSSDEN